jgi:hypothetical protein
VIVRQTLESLLRPPVAARIVAIAAGRHRLPLALPTPSSHLTVVVIGGSRTS